MKKIFFALAIIISCASIISCDVDSVSDNAQSNPNADSGGTGTVPPVKPPPPPPGNGG